MKLTGAAILVLRGMKVLQAAPAAYPYRSAWRIAVVAKSGQRLRLAVDRLACGSRFRVVSGALKGVAFTLTGRRRGQSLHPPRRRHKGTSRRPTEARPSRGRFPGAPRPTLERRAD